MKLLLTVLTLSAAGALAMPDEPAASVPKKLPASIIEIFKNRFGSGQPGKPAQREEVSYTLIQKNDKFEERTYPAWNWVCIDVELGPGGTDHTMDFLEIATYMQGQNAAGAHMALTIPVMMQRRADGGGVMCAPLPASHQATVPAPQSDRLRLVAVPPTDVFVRRFGGSPRPAEWKEQAEILRGHLAEAGHDVRPAVIKAMFSDPLQRLNRRNEVWLIKA
ncbi:heme-binding protein 2-like [Pollicipes pollicipes]|uniref:heme-binding protein 2-like n=1 Tax=Pollicipes pollicipes TaxID=41117 RepID=UPI001884AFFC|nr:heme-binding protein 2-like [Pollicipes pollicipes]